jgi:hypothetical protein
VPAAKALAPIRFLIAPMLPMRSAAYRSMGAVPRKRQSAQKCMPNTRPWVKRKRMPNNSNPPLSTDYVPLTAQLATTQSPGGTQPPIPPQQLDNPPRTRVISQGPPGPVPPFQTAPAQIIRQDPFAGLSPLDIFVIREATSMYLSDLEDKGWGITDTKESAKRILDLAMRKLDPPIYSMTPLPPPPFPKPSFFPSGGSK